MTEGKRKALIIGVSDYDHLEKLEFCKRDGDEMYNLLKKTHFQIPDEYKLTGNRVEYFQIHDKIITFFRHANTNSNDILLFYYSGHGVPDIDSNVYLATSETNPDIPMLRGFSFAELTNLMNESISTRIVTILDCCYSGAAKLGRGNEEDTVNIAANAINDKSKALRQGEGKYILAASLAAQRAYDLKEQGHGIFTYYLLEGLKGQSADEYGNVTAYSLGNYVYNAIMNLPEEKKPKQRPLIKVETAGEIILAHYPNKMVVTKLNEEAETKSKNEHVLSLLTEGNVAEFNKYRENSSRELYLSGANLNEKNLNGANLSGADLSNAVLINANLGNTHLNDVNLFKSNLSGANLSGANLSGANLSGANLYRARLINAELSNTLLKETVVIGANIIGANLSGANLDGANLVGANLSGANFDGANLSRANLSFTVLAGAKKLENSIMEETNLRNTKGLPISKDLAKTKGAYVSGFF